MNLSSTASPDRYITEFRRWYPCNCNRGNIWYFCYRPEYWVADEDTSRYPCMEDLKNKAADYDVTKV